jgi:hypothetical protein
MTYVGANCGSETSGNLLPPPDDASSDMRQPDVREEFPVANLVAPPVDAASDAVEDFPIANLVPPPDSGMR